MKKRILSLLLALAALLAMTGCASGESAPESQETAVPTETTVSVETTAALPTEEVHSEDWYQVHTLANTFAAAYFHGSRDILKLSLADTFEGEIDVYYDYHDSAEVAPNVLSVKGLSDVGDMEIGDVCHPSVEFLSGMEGDDSYTYLSLTMVKQEDGWKVQFYGLEK